MPSRRKTSRKKTSHKKSPRKTSQGKNKSPRRKSPRKTSRKKTSRRKKSPQRKVVLPNITKGMVRLDDSLLKRYSSSTSSSKNSQSQSIFNRFFDKIFIINLRESTKRWDIVSQNFKDKGIEVERYDGIDGRCKTLEECDEKQSLFETTYGVKYGKKIKNPKERLPASSLTLAHKLIYTEMVKRGWEQILICEDDVWLSNDIESRFKDVLKQLPPTWDMIYLGAGGQAGYKGLSLRKTPNNQHLTDLAPHYDEKWYVKVKEDLRSPCYKDCKKYSKDLTKPGRIGGTWAVAISQKGARKLLKIIGNRVGNHIDKIHPRAIDDKKIEAYAVDGPIIWHIEGGLRSDSTIPWAW